MSKSEESIPEHIAIIMDGNRRWAKAKGLPVALGHKEGGKTVEKVVRHANKIGIKYITVYAFSTENWKRKSEEVSGLMALMQSYLDDYTKRADSDNIKVQFIGNREQLSQRMLKSMDECAERTKNNTGTVFTIAINYGGRREIIEAVKNIASDIKEGNLQIEDINEELISENLNTKNIPDPDLLIRTSGEIRTSNFLPWQIVYSEFIFVQKNWPDFNENDLEESIEEFKRRNRKFGAN